jgi:CSLREA domain-containing protein
MGMVQGHRRDGQGGRARIVWVVLSLVLAGIALAAAPTRYALAAGNYVVNSTGDQSDENPGNNVCKIVGSNTCTLHAAIEEANAHMGADTITFNLGTATIQVTDLLPLVTDDETIIRGDGNITLNGGNIDDMYGVWITSDYNKVQGLRFENFETAIGVADSHDNIIGVDGDGVTDNTTERNVIGDNVIGIQLDTAGSTWIAGNHIGVNPGGGNANPNVYGIYVWEGRGNVIGTNADGVSDTAERNIISGNSGADGIGIYLEHTSSTRIAGNYIGTNAAGDSALPNTQGIIVGYSPYTSIGVGGLKTSSSQRNVISGNLISGVTIRDSSSVVVAGNYIGTSANGNQALGNTVTGISLIIKADFNRIGTNGDDNHDDLERNVISGNGVGIEIHESSLNIVAGNYIGTRANGTQPLGNENDGVIVGHKADGNQIGINAGGAGHMAERNVISANGGSGVVLKDENAYNSVGGNYIGTDASGTVPMGNAKYGVLINGPTNTYIGWQTPQFTFPAGNLIAHNGEDGIAITGDKSLYNQILGNAIFENDSRGIDLGDDGVTDNDPGDADEGPNHLANFPIGTAATSDGTQIGIQGKIADGIKGSELIIEFFASKSCDSSGNGEGEVFIGRAFYDLSVTGTDFNFNEVFTKSVDPGMVVTMTATWIEQGSDNSTSEFSECMEVKEGKPEGKR